MKLLTFEVEKMQRNHTKQYMSTTAYGVFHFI